MKTRFLFVGITAALCAFTLAPTEGGSDTPAPAIPDVPAPSAVGELRTQVEELLARVKSLEERSNRLEAMLERLEQRRQPPGVPVPKPRGMPPDTFPGFPRSNRSQPKIWGEREINGWTFYLIPCQQQPSRSASPSP